MTEFFVAIAIVGILGVIPIILIDIYSNYKQNQITYRRKKMDTNAKRYNRSTPSRCLSLDMGLACGYTWLLLNEVREWE